LSLPADTDLILVGGGLANLLLALRLAEQRPELRVLILEQRTQIAGDQTWSFHGSDVSAEQLAWLEPLMEQSWNNYTVRFPRRQRGLPGTYHSICSQGLRQFAEDRLGSAIHTGTTVAELHSDRVTLDDGTSIKAGAVVDGRGGQSNRYIDVRYQKFAGWVVELEEPHNLREPVVMDASVSQDDGYRFFYTLPFSPHELLIEDTHYSDEAALSAEQYGEEIRRYASRQGWKLKHILRREQGVLPITLGGDIEAFWNSLPDDIAWIGLRGQLFHPATGYSLPCAMEVADHLATLPDHSAASVCAAVRQFSIDHWHRTSFYRALNRMLFLAARPQERRDIMQRFYGLDASLIARFYAGRNTLLDKAKILAGKPPIPLRRAYESVFRYVHIPPLVEPD